MKIIVASLCAAFCSIQIPCASTAACTVEQGQSLLNQGRYEQAIRVFTCVIDENPADVSGYRGRIEAEVLLRRYSDAIRDFGLITAFVIPVEPNAVSTILASYDARLTANPDELSALTMESFLLWANFQYPQAIHSLHHLLEIEPDSVFGNLFRGSSRLLKGVNGDKGVVDIEHAIALAPASADVRFIVADAYTYGLPDARRAFAEANLALEWGLDTPRIHSILATSYFAFGDEAAAALHLGRHFELVTTELVPTPPLSPDSAVTLSLIPGRAFDIPIPVNAGQLISISTTSRDFWDSIAVLLDPDGVAVTGSDDDNAYFAAFDWVAPTAGTYRLRVTSFESLNTGELIVSRD